MEVNKVRIDGREITIHYANGKFRATVEGHEYTAESEKALIDKLRASLRTAKARLKLPITIINVVPKKSQWGHQSSWGIGIGTRHAIITGLHAQNNDLLIEDEAGTKERKRGHSWSSDGLVCRRMTPAQIDEYVALAQAAESTKKALDAFEERYKIENVEKWVAKELAAAVDQIAEPAVEATGDPRIDAPAPKKKAKR